MDNQGTAAACEPQECLQALCDKAFDGDRAKTALALGRSQEEIADMLSGDEPVDADLDMKVHGLAQERGIELG